MAAMKGHYVKRGDRWHVTVDIGTDPVSKKRRRAAGTTEPGATRKDAELLAAEIMLRHRARKPVTRAKTVGAMIEAWYVHIAADLSPTTRQGYRSKIETYLLPAFGDLPVGKLTSERIDTFYRGLRRGGVRGRPLSPATIRRVHAALSSACGQAVKWGWIRTNPCDTASPPRQIRTEIESPALANIEAVLLEASADLREAAGLAIATGARRGELCGLQWADVDFDDGSVTFRRSIGSIAGKPVIVDERRKSVVRTLAIDPVTVEMLKARRARHGELALACGIGLTDGGFVLAEEPGQRDPLPPQLLSQRWRQAAARAGVHVRLHDLRHWVTTELLAAGLPVPNVVRRQGWASPQMIKVYGHAVQRLDREAADIIAAKLAR
jgi:integrase